jgi:hypothetical protein
MKNQAVRWEEREGGRIIRFYEPLVSPGWSGNRWLLYLKTKKFGVNDFVKSVLLSEDFRPQPGREYHPVILKWPLWPDETRNEHGVLWTACEIGIFCPAVEQACLLRCALRDEDLQAMGLDWLNVMHPPIMTAAGAHGRLELTHKGGGRWLSGHPRQPGYRYPRGEGFLFEDTADVVGSGKRHPVKRYPRRPSSSLPPEPSDYDDPEQMSMYLAELRRFFRIG